MSNPTQERTFSNLTPYKAAQVATDLAKKAGRTDLLNKDGIVPPQKFYNLKVPWKHGTAKRDGGTGVYFEGAKFNEYLQNMLAGSVVGGTNVRGDLASLLAEYAIDRIQPETDAEVAESEDAEDELERQLEASLAEVEQDEPADEVEDEPAEDGEESDTE